MDGKFEKCRNCIAYHVCSAQIAVECKECVELHGARAKEKEAVILLKRAVDGREWGLSLHHWFERNEECINDIIGRKTSEC